MTSCRLMKSDLRELKFDVVIENWSEEVDVSNGGNYVGYYFLGHGL